MIASKSVGQWWQKIGEFGIGYGWLFTLIRERESEKVHEKRGVVS